VTATFSLTVKEEKRTGSSADPELTLESAVTCLPATGNAEKTAKRGNSHPLRSNFMESILLSEPSSKRDLHLKGPAERSNYLRKWRLGS